MQKKLLSSILAVFCFSMAALSAENWIQFEDRIYLDHSASKKVSEDMYFIKMKVLNGGENAQNLQNVGYTVIEETIDCQKNLMLPESVALYDSKNELIGKRTKEEIAVKFQEIQPDFVEYRIKEKICAGKLIK